MKTKHLLLGLVLLLAAGAGWFGRREWRARHQLVTLNVRNVSLAQVLKQIEGQTRQKIRAERGIDTRITLRVTNKPLTYVLDRLAEQTSARWSTVYAVYDSPKALSALESTLASDGKLEGAGWTRLAPSPPDLQPPAELGDTPANGPILQTKPLPPDLATGTRVTSTEDAVVTPPGAPGARGTGGPPRIFRVSRQDRNGETEQEVWTPEELVLEAGLKGRLGNPAPEDATPETAAQTAGKVNGRWTTLYAFRKSRLGLGGGGLFIHRGPPPGPGGPMIGGSNAPGTDLPPPMLGDFQGAGPREGNDQFARLTPEQRVQHARARQGLDEKGKPQ